MIVNQQKIELLKQQKMNQQLETMIKAQNKAPTPEQGQFNNTFKSH
jgi:hypothetical protein